MGEFERKLEKELKEKYGKIFNDLKKTIEVRCMNDDIPQMA